MSAVLERAAVATEETTGIAEGYKLLEAIGAEAGAAG